MRSLIGRKQYQINEDIVINIPTLRQIRADTGDTELHFWQEARMFMITPDSMCSELEDMGIDFEQLSNYDLFLFLFVLQKNDKQGQRSLLFNNINFWGLEYKSVLADVNDIVDRADKYIPSKYRNILVDKTGKEIFNEYTYTVVSEVICEILGQEMPKPKKFGNAFAKKKWVERDRKKKSHRKNTKEEMSVFDGIILRLVCNANFPYNFETIQDVTVYDIIQSLKQIEKDIQVNELMDSRLVGNDLTKLPKEQLSRFVL